MSDQSVFNLLFVVGFLSIDIALWAIDWRLGLGFAGLVSFTLAIMGTLNAGRNSGRS